jgi:UDP-N-acetylbacillosamine N-acetyltransferase
LLACSDGHTELPDGWLVLAAAGDNFERQRQIEIAIKRDHKLALLISKRAYVGMGAAIGPGTFVAHNTHVGRWQSSDAAPSSIPPRWWSTTAASGILLMSRQYDDCGPLPDWKAVFLGAGATVIDGVRIIDGVTIGAGSTVIDDIVEPGVHVGCPARRIEA